MRKHLLTAFGMVIASLLCIQVQAQKKTITGKITDSTGAPIPNVSVRLKSSSTGVSTLENGVFQISALPTDVLIISNVGFSTEEVRIGNRTNVTVVLNRRAQNLDEVVVTTALGLKRTRNSLPYATQQITGAEIMKTPTSNFVDNLSGKIAGLQVTSSNTMGGSNNVILRGIKSLTQTNQALFVVDGIPYDNTNSSASSFDLGNAVADINPNEIESMNVLKGAAASALYGSRASNGVIIITTKKGSKRKGIGVEVSFGATTGKPDHSTLPVYQEEYGEGLGSQGGSGSPNPYFYYLPTFNSGGAKQLIVQTDVDQMTGPAYDKNLMVYNWDAFSPGNPNYGKATPWVAAPNHNPTDYFVTPVTTITNVAAEGGNDVSGFRMGYTRSVDKGYMPNSSETKSQLNLSAHYDLTPGLRVGAQIAYTDNWSIGRYGYGYAGVNQMTDFRQWWETNIDLKAQKADFFRTNTNATWNWLGGYTTNVPGSIVKPAYHDNVYWTKYRNFETDQRTRYTGNAYLNWKVTSFLNVLGRVSIDQWNLLLETRSDVGSSASAAYGRTNTSFSETNYDLLINFDKTYGQLNVKALLGGNIRQNLTTGISAASNGGLVVPGFFALANSVNTPNAPSETYTPKEVDGVFAGATLSWKDMVTLDGTIRRDKSSTLPPAHASYYYPAVSANWVFTKILPQMDWLTYGKLRANYAAVGGDAAPFSTANTYTAGTPFNGQTVFGAPTTNANPNLVPERTKTYEAGVELSFLKGRIGLDVTYYNAKTYNQIMPITVSPTSGYGQFQVNGGTLQNKGVEVSLNLVPVRTQDFTWNMTVNWSQNINKALSLYNNQPSVLIQSYQNSVQMVAEVGKSWGIFRGTDYVYTKDGGRIVDANGYYIKNTNKLTDIGNINPVWIGGVNNSFRYKNFTFSFLVDVRYGGDIYSLDLDYGASAGLTPHTAGKNAKGTSVRAPLSQNGGYLFPGVTADGKPNTVYVDASDINTGKFPFSSPNQEVARTYMYDASYIKLREAAFSWSVPKKFTDKLNYVKGIELSITGKNLWIIHKNLPYADPEQGVASGNGSMGFQSGSYPVFRTLGANLRVKF